MFTGLEQSARGSQIPRHIGCQVWPNTEGIFGNTYHHMPFPPDACGMPARVAAEDPAERVSDHYGCEGEVVEPGYSTWLPISGYGFQGLAQYQL